VLFFDEPTTGLDPHSRAELWNMTRELVADGTTVLLTTQYMEEADRLASRIAVVDRGRVIALDTPAALKARMGGTVIEFGLDSEATAELAAKVLSRLDDHRPEREREAVRVTTDEGPRYLMEALRALDGQGLTPESLSVRQPSLDDVFLALTGRHAEGVEEGRPKRGRRREGAA
jgi:ABC-type multidrug transport system ATPase subunit